MKRKLFISLLAVEIALFVRWWNVPPPPKIQKIMSNIEPLSPVGCISSGTTGFQKIMSNIICSDYIVIQSGYMYLNPKDVFDLGLR